MSESQRPTEPRLSYTIDEVVAATGLARTRIYNAIQSKRLTARKEGKATIILAQELTEFLWSLPARGKQPDVDAA